MVDGEPVLAALDVGEAVARGQGLCLAILHVGERVVTGIDGRIAVYPDR